MRFLAKVVDARHRVASLALEADDAADARRQLAARGVDVLSLEPAGLMPAWSWRVRTQPGGDFPLLSFAQELLSLLDAGLSIPEVLEALLEKESQPAARAVLGGLQQGLKSGLSLSSAMARAPRVFPPLFVGMVAAAEGTSNLHAALSRYIDYRSGMEAIRNKVIGALLYPAILLLVGGAVTLFLMGYVVPRFASVYEGSGRALPWASQLLLSWGQVLQHHAQLIGALCVLALAGLIVMVRRGLSSGVLVAWLQRLPWVGERARVMELSRLYLTLGLLLEGGLGMLQALTLAASVAGPQTAERLARVREAVRQGRSLSDALAAASLVTPVSIRFLRAGEAAGSLGPMLRKAAVFYDADTARWIERFTRVFEPLLMAVIGLVIGLIVLFLYLPIFDLAGALP